MFADVYATAGQVGIPPNVVDALEVWEVAAMLGADYEREGPAPTDGPAVASGRPKRDLVRERVLHAKGLGPMPEPDPPSPTVMALATRLRG